MPGNQATPEQELEQLRARLAALEQLQEAQEKTVVEQAARLEQSLEELRARSQEQAASEEALRHQKTILQSILDSLADGVVVADASGHFLHFNPAAEQILGVGLTSSTSGEWANRYGLYLPDAVTPYPAQDLPLSRAMRGERVDGAEVLVRHPTRPEGVWVSCNARPLVDRSGVVTGGAVVFRDITRRKRAERRLAAQHAVTRVLAEAESLDDAVPKILESICSSVGWEVGAIWRVDAWAGVLRCIDVWQLSGGQHADFLELTRRTALKPGEGLPGRLWESGQPIWITDILSDANFPRAPVAARSGLRGAFGFPIFFAGEVTGALEFFSREISKPDDDLLRMFGSLGSQIGQFLERKRAEAELRRQRERFELCVRGSGDGIWDWELETNLVYFSPRWKSMLGYAEDEIANRYEEWESRLHPEDRERALSTLQAYLEGEIPAYELEHRLRHKDGSYRWILARGLVVRDPDGRPYRMAGSHTDVTDRRRMEEQLRNEEALYHSLVETLPLNIFRKDLDGRFTFGNQRFLDNLGKSLDRVLGKTDYDFFPAATARKYSRDDLRVIRTGQLLEDVEEHYKPDGEKIYVQVLKAPVRDANANVVGVQGIFWDVTARKRAEEELQKAKEAAEAANRAKSLFLANMSHEIRTPMNAIIGMTELVLDSPLGVEQRECLETVRKAADHLLTVINDILDFTKIEAGKLDIDQVEFRLRECLDDAVGTLAIRAHQQGLELAIRIPPETPDLLVGDPGRLRQILVNLIGNAIKFTEKGEVVLRVAVEEQSEDEAVLHFEITDTGIGIPPEKLSLIFAPFVQVDGSLTRKRGGTGLGLAISRRLVEMMGGRLRAESQPGRGSRFAFTARFGIHKGAPPVSPAGDPAKLRGLAVLVVDDNGTNRFILQEILESWRMRPTVVAGGAEALEVLRQAASQGEPFPLALIDAHMPEMDGFQLADSIRRDPELKATAVVMLTSGVQTGDAARRRELGLAACLNKPVKQAELLKTLARVLGEQEAAATPDTAREIPSVPVARPLRILLVEDNPINQNLAVRLLGKQGHEIVLADNGQEALTALEQGTFDLALMDLQMPVMDGLEATAAIRAREKERGGYGPEGRRLPILAMTAFAMAGDREKCFEVGMDGYISKPVRARELFEAIDRISTATEPTNSPPQSTVDSNGIDWSSALEYVAGDEGMLRDLIGIFLTEAPRWMTELRQAIAAGNSGDVKRLAHNLKGSVRIFGAKSAFDSAFSLEQMSRSGNLSGAEEAYAALAQGIDRLTPALMDKRNAEG